MSTGAVAELLGVSRQHVVDLCNRGDLRVVWVGSHRRIAREDADRLVDFHPTRDQERLLWLHNAVAGRLVVSPQAVLERAWINIRVLEQRHPEGMAAQWIARWKAVLVDGVHAVLEVLTSRSESAIELRQNSPFAGVLDDDERSRILAAFRDHWRREHAL